MTSVPRAGLPGTNFERTFIAIKPDGVQRSKVGNIISRFEAKGYKLVALKMLTPTKEKAAGHYADLSKKPFFGGLVEYFASGPIVAMVWEGINAIDQGRVLLGATNPKDSAPGTIRGDLCVDIGRNICHGSDGPGSAKHEIEFWFDESEVQAYTSHSNMWVYEKGAKVAAGAAPAAAAAAPVVAAAAAAPAETGGKKNKKKKKSNKAAAKKEEVKAAPVAAGPTDKKKKACIKEGGKKGQDLGGMSTFGVTFFLTNMEEPAGDLALLNLCMEGANKEVEADAEDRKGGAGDLAKVFFSASDTNFSMICHVPVECVEKSTNADFMNAVMAPVLKINKKATFTKVDGFFSTFSQKNDPDAGLYSLKLRDECISAGFEFLRSRSLILDDDSDDDVCYGADQGIDIGASADGNDY